MLLLTLELWQILSGHWLATHHGSPLIELKLRWLILRQQAFSMMQLFWWDWCLWWCFYFFLHFLRRVAQENISDILAEFPIWVLSHRPMKSLSFNRWLFFCVDQLFNRYLLSLGESLSGCWRWKSHLRQNHSILYLIWARRGIAFVLFCHSLVSVELVIKTRENIFSAVE